MKSVNEIRRDFPMLNKENPVIYFDNGATTFKPQCVIDGVNRYYNEITANAHRGDYDMSVRVDEAYDHCRQSVARLIHADKDEVVFTYGATASLNSAIVGYGAKLLKKGDVILTTYAEHASCILPLFRVAKEKGAIIRYIPLTKDGRFTVENFASVMNESVKLVAFAAVTNVIGYLAPVKEIVEKAHQYGATVIVDGAQSVPHHVTDVKDWDCDFLAFSSHKMCGPTGIGVLYGKKEKLEAMDPIFLGGGSNARFTSDGEVVLKSVPERFESGTMPIEAVMGFDQAIQYLEDIGLDHITQREHQLHQYAIEKMLKLDNLEIYNPYNDSGIIAFNVKGVFAQDAGGYLASKNICLRSGNHCAKLLDHVIGTNATLRCSLYFYNTEEEIDALVEALKTTTVENCVSILL